MIMDWSFAWVIVVVLLMDGYLYWHFNHIFNVQFDLTNKLIAKVKGHSVEDVEVIIAENIDDPNRTHILGGFVHGDAVCANECWCKVCEEE